VSKNLHTQQKFLPFSRQRTTAMQFYGKQQGTKGQKNGTAFATGLYRRYIFIYTYLFF